MILNAFAVLDWFVVVLRCFLALVVTALGWRTLRDSRLADVPDPSLENRSYLLLSLSMTLAGLNVVAWPLLYMYLQSMVAQWTGAMCVYGITQIGRGRDDISGLLPTLVTLLENFKPFQVFVTGIWFVLYRINRKTQAAPLSHRIILVQVILGVLTLVDGFVEASYLAIPKQNETYSVGCCTVAYVHPQSALRSLVERMAEPQFRLPMIVTYFAVHACLIASLLGSIRRNRQFLRTLVFAFTLTAIPITAVFMIGIAAPTVLHLPHHHCLYDLIPKAPDMLFGIGLFVLGTFSIGWATAVRWLGTVAETRSLVSAEQVRLFTLAAYCFLGSMIVTALEMVLA